MNLMNELLFMSLTHISSELINLIGVAASPLIVLITYQVFRTRGFAGMPDVEIQNKVLDISFETIHAQIEKHLHTSVLHFYGDHFILPPGLTFSHLAMSIHNNSRTLEQILPIYRNISEFGLQSAEFHQVVEMIQQFL